MFLGCSSLPSFKHRPFRTSWSRITFKFVVVVVVVESARREPERFLRSGYAGRICAHTGYRREDLIGLGTERGNWTGGGGKGVRVGVRVGRVLSSEMWCLSVYG